MIQKNATLLRKSLPDLLTHLPHVSLVLRLPRIFPDPLQMFHARCTIPCKTTSKCPKVLRSVPLSFLHFWLRNVLRATTACTFSTSQLPKVLWTWCALYILTWKYASRHNGLHFFNISTSKNALNLSVFNTFDFEMCFAPQLFPHLNFKKWSEHGLFCTFWPHQPL